MNLQLDRIAVYLVGVGGGGESAKHGVAHPVQLFSRKDEVRVARVDGALFKQPITHTRRRPTNAASISARGSSSPKAFRRPSSRHSERGRL